MFQDSLQVILSALVLIGTYVQTVEVDYRSDKCVTGIGIGKTLFGLRLRIILSAQQTLVVRVISSV